MEIRTGTLLDCETASGEHVKMRALGGVVQGYDFPVVWVCTLQEWDRAQEAGSEPDGIPWPHANLRAIEPAPEVA